MAPCGPPGSAHDCQRHISYRRISAIWWFFANVQRSNCNYCTWHFNIWFILWEGYQSYGALNISTGPIQFDLEQIATEWISTEMHSNHHEMSAGPKRPPLPIKEFFYQHLKFQRIFNKNEKIRTNENSISLYFIYNYTQTKITYMTIHI